MVHLNNITNIVLTNAKLHLLVVFTMRTTQKHQFATFGQNPIGCSWDIFYFICFASFSDCRWWPFWMVNLQKIGKIDNSENQGPTKVPYKISAKNMKLFWRKSWFYWYKYTISSITGHLGLSISLNLISLKAWNLVMLHLKFLKHGCKGFRE